MTGESFLLYHRSTHHTEIFIDRSTAHIADTGKFADIELAGLVGRIMPVEDGRDGVRGDPGPADPFAFRLRVCHA